MLLAFLVEKSRFFGGILIAELESTFGICSNRHFAPFPLLGFAQIVILLHFHFWKSLKSSFCSISTFGICSNRHFAPFPLLEFAQNVILLHFHFWKSLKSSFCSISTFGNHSNRRFAPFPLLEFAQNVILGRATKGFSLLMLRWGRGIPLRIVAGEWNKGKLLQIKAQWFYRDRNTEACKDR